MEIELSTLIKAIRDDIAPCDACNHRVRCRESRLACNVFSEYVNGGEPELVTKREPTAEIYKRIFVTADRYYSIGGLDDGA